MRGDEEVNVILEMPGVNKEDIYINADENSVDVRAEGGAEGEERRYSESVDLGCEVIPESGKAGYNNGSWRSCSRGKSPKRRGRR